MSPSSRTPKVALAVGGSIAAYKAVMVARLLLTRGVEVQPLLTASAARFVGPATFAGICGTPALTEMFDPAYGGERHVDLAREIDLLLIAPATADLLARLAAGRADDLVTALALCSQVPIVVAPAMHSSMWSHPATRRNVRTLLADGRVELVGPSRGALASGEIGEGRLAEPEAIVDFALSRLGRKKPATDLLHARVVVSAGPTVEDFDPVRFLSNRSSGRMGFAIAERAAARGAEVVLVTGPVALETPPGVTRADVRSALEMQSALDRALAGADALVMAAAVSDYRPAAVQPQKIKKTGDAITLDLVKNPDLVAAIGARRQGPKPVLVGFALETAEGEALVAYARRKLVEKKVDLIVANAASDGFGGERNRAVLVAADREEALEEMSKRELADRLLDRVLGLLRQPARAGDTC